MRTLTGYSPLVASRQTLDMRVVLSRMAAGTLRWMRTFSVWRKVRLALHGRVERLGPAGHRWQGQLVVRGQTLHVILLPFPLPSDVSIPGRGGGAVEERYFSVVAVTFFGKQEVSCFSSDKHFAATFQCPRGR